MTRVREARSVGEVRALEKDWRKLVEKGEGGNMFVSFDWVLPWFECAPGSKPLVLSAWEEGEMVGVAPLCIEGGTLCFAAQAYSAHLDLAAKRGWEKRSAEAFAERILENREWKEVKFLHLKDESRLAEALQKKAEERGLAVERRQGEASNVVELPKSMEGYFSSLKRSRRRWLKKKSNRLERGFSTGLGFLGRGEWEKGWKEFLELHRKHLGEKGEKSVLNREWFQCFYKRAGERALGKGKLFFMRLSLNGKTAGLLLGIAFREKLNALNVGLDTGIAERYSLGKLLLFKAIEPCMEKGISCYDLLPGGASYKRALGARQESGLEMHVFRSRARALGKGLLREAKGMGKRVLEH